MADDPKGDVREEWVLSLDHPVRPASRWGHGRPAHPELGTLIDAGRSEYAAYLSGCLDYVDAYRTIARDYTSDDEPYWRCGWLSPLDLITLYTTVVKCHPRTYLEVGSGCSTAFVRHAISTFGLNTRIVSIDPEPRAGIDAICDTVVRAPLETVDHIVLEELQPGDVFFVDGSHRCFPNSDVTVTFLEVLPRLPEHITIGIDDIYLPDDYPPAWRDRLYSEQYILAAWLLGGASRLTILCPNHYASHDDELSRVLASLWMDPTFEGLPTDGNTFWARTTR